MDENECFIKNATLNQSAFYNALSLAGYPQISESPLAEFIYTSFCRCSSPNDNNGNDSGGGGMEFSTFRSVLKMASKGRNLFRKVVGEDGFIADHKDFRAIVMRILLTNVNSFYDIGNDDDSSNPPKDSFVNIIRGKIENITSVDYDDECTTGLHDSAELHEYLNVMLDEAAFHRYAFKNNDYIEETEFIIFYITIYLINSTFDSIIDEKQQRAVVTKDNYHVGLERLGLPNARKVLQGQLYDSLYDRADINNDGVLCIGEFAKSIMKFVYPVDHFLRLKNIEGYPGWDCLKPYYPPTREQLADVAKLVKELRTGDVILMQDTIGPLGRFINHTLDTPWCHASLVVKRRPLSGIPNERTEAILRRYPFRRSSHRFCSPGYCRCFDNDGGDFAASQFEGLGEVGLLESTGEGIHLYDLASRLFEPGGKMWNAMAVVRLHDVPDRDDGEKIDEFIRGVRGGIYTVAKNELKGAIEFHKRESVPGADDTLPQGDRDTDDFCASLVMRFYRWMGWVDGTRKRNSVMPSDFELEGSECPVTLAKGYFGPLELIVSPDLGATLPLKLPRKKKTEKKT